MNKKLVIGIIVILIIIIGGVFAYSKLSNTSKINTSSEGVIKNNTETDDDNVNSNSKILVVYFSA